MHNTSAGDKNITLSIGWNLIGYSSATEVALSAVNFTNSTGSRMSWNESINDNQLRAYATYYDGFNDTTSERKYKHAALNELSMDDTLFRQGKGYWIYANDAGNLTITGAGGSDEGETFDWSDLWFRNSSMSEKVISDADTANWVFGTGDAAYVNYWDAPNFKQICGDILGECEDTVLSPWEGYWVYSNFDNMTLVREN